MVDDGSTDETAEVAAAYAGRGVRYLHAPQGGAGQARNAGLRATSSPLVAFLDADDAWLPHRVAAGVEHLERHPGAALVAAHAFACDEAMRPSSVVHALRGPACGSVFEELLIHNVVLNPSSVLVRRSALEAAGGFSEIPFGEDWDTWLQIAKRFPIGFMDEVVALVRRHTEQHHAPERGEPASIFSSPSWTVTSAISAPPGSGRSCGAAPPRPPSCTPGSAARSRATGGWPGATP